MIFSSLFYYLKIQLYLSYTYNKQNSSQKNFISILFFYFNLLILKLIRFNRKQISMGLCKRLERSLFAKMVEFQQQKSTSVIYFTIIILLKFLLQDVFITLVFLYPVQAEMNFRKSFFPMLITYGKEISYGCNALLFLVFFLSFYNFNKKKWNYYASIGVVNLVRFFGIFSSLLIVTLMYIPVKALASKDYLIFLSSGINLFLVMTIQIIFNTFDYTASPKEQSLFQKRRSTLLLLVDFLKLIFGFYVCLRHCLNSIPFFEFYEYILYNSIYMIFTLIQAREIILKKFYLNRLSQNIVAIFLIGEINIRLIITIFNIVDMPIVSNNILVLEIIMTLLAFAALYSYIKNRDQKLFLSCALDIKSEKDAYFYIDCLAELSKKIQNQDEDLFIVSLRKKHQLDCQKIECFCHSNSSIYYFAKQYIRQELENLKQVFHNSPQILIAILYFKMKIFNFYPQILMKINYFQSHFKLNIFQRFSNYCLAKELTSFIEKKNQQIKVIDSQNLFKLEDIIKEIEIVVKSDIQTRCKKWKYLSRGLCRISQLESNCNNLIQHITQLMKLYNKNKTKFKKSREFNLILLFYFVKVSFLRNGRQIIQNLKQIFYGYKQDELYNIKQFQKFIYYKKSCVIQTLVDTKVMGVITLASKNIQAMFGFPLNKMIGMNINKLMPDFMASEHEEILKDWSKSGTWRTVGKLKEIYGIHKEQFCFSALLYLKIYVKNNSLHFITSIFKLNETDYLVLNPNMRIQGIGRKFLKLLGEPAKKISFETLVQQHNNIFEQQQVYNKVYRKIVYSLKNMKKQVEDYLEKLNSLHSEEEKKIAKQLFHQILKEGCEQKYQIEFSMSSYKMGRIKFPVICLRQAKKIQSNSYARLLTPNILYKDEYLDKNIIDINSEKDFFSSQHNDKQQIIEHNANSSLASISDKQNYPLSKLMERYLEYLDFPEKISDKRLFNINIIIITLCSALLLVEYSAYFLYRQNLLEIQGIFFADGAVSDVLQVTQITYNQLYVLKSQVANTSDPTFQSTLLSNQILSSYVYSLQAHDVLQLTSDVTELKKKRLYAYLEKPAYWKLDDGTVIKLETFQFLANMYYLTNQAMQNFKSLRTFQVNLLNFNAIQRIKDNFDEMKRLNQYYLTDYNQIANQSHSLLMSIIIFSLILFFLMSLILSILLNRYFKFRFDQKINSFNFFSYIPNHFLQKMKDYYTLLYNTAIENNNLAKIDKNEEKIFKVDSDDIFRRNQKSSSLISKIKFVNYQKYSKWAIIFLMLLIFNGVNYIITSKIISFVSPSESFIQQINQLMRSENKLLQCYFDLKAAYYQNASKNINIKLYNELFQHMNQSEVIWNAVANGLTSLFQDYDPTYQQRFVNSLVTSVCKLTTNSLSEFQNKKCIKQLKLNILDAGILISMNFFQRNIREAMEDLKLQYINKTRQVYKGDYFSQQNFVQIDKMLVYMFKIFQMTQACSYDAYINAIELITGKYLEIVIYFILFFAVTIICWFYSLNHQKRQLSRLYGHILLVPFVILKTNVRIVQSIKQLIEEDST